MTSIFLSASRSIGSGLNDCRNPTCRELVESADPVSLKRQSVGNLLKEELELLECRLLFHTQKLTSLVNSGKLSRAIGRVKVFDPCYSYAYSWPKLIE